MCRRLTGSLNFGQKAFGFLCSMFRIASRRALSKAGVFEQVRHRQDSEQTLLTAKH